jgi:predicted nucleic acid-binding Zn ribbon protein
MKCLKHSDAEAVAVCPYCGKALCAPCATAFPAAAPRLACSNECATAMTRNERALEMLLQKSRQSARANSVYCYLCGALSAGATVACWFWMQIPLLLWLTGGSAVVLVISGIWFGRGAKKMN